MRCKGCLERKRDYNLHMLEHNKDSWFRLTLFAFYQKKLNKLRKSGGEDDS